MVKQKKKRGCKVNLNAAVCPKIDTYSAGRGAKQTGGFDITLKRRAKRRYFPVMSPV
jgi:hypothetical protein